MQQRAEPAERVARHGDAFVDGEAGHLLAAVAAHHPRFVRMNGEALGRDDFADEFEQRARLFRRLAEAENVMSSA